MMITLRIISGPHKGKEFPLIAGENSIGRDNSSRIRLNSKTVSRNHALLLLAPDGTHIQIKDNSSSNGIIVNGEKVTSQDIYAGDSICIGEYRMQVIDTSKPPPDEQEQTSTRKEQFSATPHAPPAEESKVISKTHTLVTLGLTFFKSLQWSTLTLLVIAAAFLINHFLVITPIIHGISNDLATTAIERGRLLAKNLAEHNQTSLAQENPLLLDCKSILNEPGVKKAFIINQNMRIVCPAHQQDYIRDALTSSAVNSATASDNCERMVLRAGADACSLTAPIQTQENYGTEPSRTIGAARILFAPAESQKALQALQHTSLRSLAFTLIIMGGLFFLLMRITRRPIERFQDELYNTLSGSMAPIRKSFSIKQLNDLIVPINSLLERFQTLRQNSVDESGEPNTLSRSINFNALAKGLAGHYLITDTDTRLLAMTPELAKLLDLSPSDTLAKPLKEILSEETLAAEFLEAAQRAQDTPDSFTSSNIVINGTPYSLNVKVVAEHATAGYLFFSVM